MERKENIAVFDMNLKTMDSINMKEEDETPQVEVIECETEGVLCISGVVDDSDDVEFYQ